MTGDLIEQARILADRVGALSTAVDQLDRRAGRSEKVVVAVVAGLLLDLILSVVVALVLVQLGTANEHILATQAREAQTRQEVLCPFYSLVLGTYNPNTRAEGPDRDEYIRQFDVMRRSHKALDCQGPLIPPAAPR